MYLETYSLRCTQIFIKEDYKDPYLYLFIVQAEYVLIYRVILGEWAAFSESKTLQMFKQALRISANVGCHLFCILMQNKLIKQPVCLLQVLPISNLDYHFHCGVFKKNWLFIRVEYF